MSVVISKQEEITRIASHIDALAIGHRAEKVHSDILLQNLETAINKLFQIVGAKDTNEHDRRFAGSLMMDYHGRVNELKKSKGSKTIKTIGRFGIGAIFSVALGIFAGAW